MNQQRLSEIWDKLLKGNRVLGWTHVEQADKHILVPVNAPRTWERDAPDGKWDKIEGVRTPSA